MPTKTPTQLPTPIPTHSPTTHSPTPIPHKTHHARQKQKAQQHTSATLNPPKRQSPASLVAAGFVLLAVSAGAFAVFQQQESDPESESNSAERTGLKDTSDEAEYYVDDI